MNNNTKIGKFFLLPISFLGDLFREEYPFLKMLYYGILDAGSRMKINASFEHKCKALNFSWCRSQDILTPMLMKAMDNFQERGIVEKRFIWSNNIPDVPDLCNAISTDPNLVESVNLWYRTLKSCEAFGFTNAVCNVLQYATTPSANRDAGEPCFMVSADLVFKARTINKEERRKLLYAMAFGIDSIVGSRKKFAATTKDMILARTFGCRNISELNRILCKDKDIAPVYHKASTRRNFDHLRADLLASGMVKMFVGIGRKTYISTTHDFGELKEEIIEFRNHTKTINKMNSDIRNQLIDKPP